MDFDFISPGRVRVTVSPQELRRAGIDPEKYGEADIKRLKRFILLLLAQIKLRRGFPLGEKGSLQIEIYPDGYGGAEIYFTLQREPPELCEPEIFCFSNSDDLINAALNLFSRHCHRLFQSSLYLCGEKWLFIVRPLDGSSSPVLALLSEYGSPVPGGSAAAALIMEHGKPIIREHAADMLSFYFS